MADPVLIPNPKKDSAQVRSLQSDFTETEPVHSPARAPALEILPLVLGNQSAQRMLAPIVIQPKLTIGSPDDIYEKEADAVAEQVMSFHAPRATGDASTNDDQGSHSRLARKSAHQGLPRRAILGRIPILTLQKTLGNRALARLLQEKSRTLDVRELRCKCACGGRQKENAPNAA